jgi:hypothetical protein
MSDFEFLSVLISIVIGFGLTHLLGGLGYAYHFRKTNKMDAVHVAWTIAVFFLLVLNWWVFLLWRGFESWTFAVFFTIVMWAVSMYVLALALYPPRLARDVDYRTLFESNRTWLLATFIIMLLLDLVVTGIRDEAVPETFFIVYLGHYITIAAVGIVVRKRFYDLFAAWYMAITMALWSFGIRGTLF